MGIYTNTAGFGGYGSYSSPSYDTVEPFALSEHYNYHELGIVAATESAMNRDMFMQSIGIAEANALAQYGDENVFYESVNLGGIFQKIKMFFKKIIEKIQKIFHTFIAKMSSWFSSSKDFAKKYGKEITTKWGRIKNDLDFKGYQFEHLVMSKEDKTARVTTWKNEYTGTSSSAIKDFIDAASSENENELVALLKSKFVENIPGTTPSTAGGVTTPNANIGDTATAGTAAHIGEECSKWRSDKFDDFKDNVRRKIVEAIKSSGIHGMGQAQFDLSASGGYDQKEYTEELYKVFRKDEDSKQSLSKKEIETTYGGSITNLLGYLTDYDKIKSTLEACQKGMTSAIDKFIGAFDKAEKQLVKGADTERKKSSSDAEVIKHKEVMVSVCVLCQDILGFTKEAQIQAFGAALQAQKEACSQAKEICVMTIGQSKKVTEESYDYGNSGDFGSFANGLIENTVIR